MANKKPGTLQIKSFGDHHVITQPNPLRKVLLRVPESDLDDPVARAEKALEGLSGEFKNWMTIEADRLSAAPADAHAVLPQSSGRDPRALVLPPLRRGGPAPSTAVPQRPTLLSTSAFRKRSITSMKPTEGTSRMSAVIEAIW